MILAALVEAFVQGAGLAIAVYSVWKRAKRNIAGGPYKPIGDVLFYRVGNTAVTRSG